MQSVVHVVHCVDTEGPLRESLEATFERLETLFGLRLEPSADTLRSLQNGEIDLDGLEDEVTRVVDPRLLAHNETWEQIEEMLDECLSPGFRGTVTDSFGGGWIYNWFCLDHVGFGANPRRRDLGFHNIFDRYRGFLGDRGCDGDGVHFHHHPLAISRSAHHSASHFFANGAIIYEILARRILDRGWFPCVFRPGFHAERPDSHWFLEQFIPFDFGNQGQPADGSAQSDQTNGRFGDWRRSPRTWTPYHPHPDDYQKEGACRRWIARCLNVGTRHTLLSQSDVDQAFKEASEGKPAIMAFTNHDHRDIRPDVSAVGKMLATASGKFPAVRFRFSEARDAMRNALGLVKPPPLRMDIAIEGSRVSISAQEEIFGPQPFLAIKTRDGDYFHDNLDLEEPFRRWRYVLDEMTVPPGMVDSIGVGACDAYGNSAVTALEIGTGKKTVTDW